MQADRTALTLTNPGYAIIFVVSGFTSHLPTCIQGICRSQTDDGVGGLTMSSLGPSLLDDRDSRP